MYRNQGVWGDRIQLGNPFMEGAQIGQMLGGMRGAFAQANLQDEQTLNQPVLREGYGLNNDLNRLNIQYYPQQQAVELAKAYTGIDQNERVNNRFNNEIWQFANFYGKMPGITKSQINANLGNELGDLVWMQMMSAKNGISQPRPAENPIGIQARAVLEPYSKNQENFNVSREIKQPQGAFEQYQQQPQGAFGFPIQTQNSGGAFSNVMPSDNFQNAQKNTSIDPIQQKIRDAISSSGQIDVANKTYNTVEKRAIEAGNKFEALYKQITPFIDDAANYAGFKGNVNLFKDKSLSALDKNSPQYLGYQAFESGLEKMKSELAIMLQKRSTNSAQQEINKILTPETLWSNPELFKAAFAQSMQNAKAVDEINRIPLGGQITEKQKEEWLDKAADIPDGRRFGVIWFEGRPYTDKMWSEEMAREEAKSRGKK